MPWYIAACFAGSVSTSAASIWALISGSKNEVRQPWKLVSLASSLLSGL